MFSLGQVKKVSVLVPVYNVERYLRQCLASVLAQTLKEIEVICVNDGSTDSSLAILKEYASKDSRIKIINQKNSGYGAAMNVAANSILNNLNKRCFFKTFIKSRGKVMVEDRA